MNVLRKLIAGVLLLSLVTFVALFGRLPALRKTPIGWLQRVLCLHIPNTLKAVDRSITGGTVTRKSRSLGRYLFYQQNPVVLIIYLFLLTGSVVLFLWNAVHLLPLSRLLPVPVVIALPYIFTHLCVTYKAHYIAPDNHEARMNDYAYDYILFNPNVSCKTCALVKPARSKHCSFCGHCVAKCDHHCPWVNNCLGRGNYRWFLALLLSLSQVQIYGAYLSWYILRPHMSINTATPLFSFARLETLGDAIVVAVNYGGLSIFGVGLLAASTASLPTGLLLYHLYLIWAGMTTNESAKWTEWKEDMEDGYVFKAKKQHLREHNLARGMNAQASQVGINGNPALSVPDRDYYETRGRDTTDYVLVRTNDGKPPRGQEQLWDRVWSLRDIDNIYDLGVVENFLEVLRGR